MPYANFEPLSTVLNLVGDFAQIHNQLDDASAQQMGMTIGFSIMHAMGDKSWWRTVTSMTDVAGQIHEGVSPSARLLDIALSPATTVASLGAIGGAVKRAIDPIQREALTMKDMFLSRIPGYSESVPPLRDAYFDPVLPPQNIAGPWLGVAVPFLKVKAVDGDDWVKNEGDRLKIKVPPFPQSLGG
jgi:hypothetical protein